MSSELIAAIADELPVAVWVARAPSGEFVWANKLFAEIMGMGARDDVAVGAYAQPYGIHDREGRLYPEERMPFVQALRARATVTLDDIVIHRPDGAKRYVRAVAKPLYEGGEIAHIAITFTDISREVEAEHSRIESEARLVHGQKMESIGNLASGIAHDFNNLLASIKLLASLMRLDEKDPVRVENLDRIGRTSDSALQLTRSLLGFARPGSRPNEPVSLDEVVDSVVAVFERTVDRRIIVERRLEARGGFALGDRSRLEHVLFNLLINARDAMPEGGTVRVSTDQVMLDGPAAAARAPLAPGRYVRVEVRDEGPGIPVPLRKRIFEPYFTTKMAGPVRGTGLGLALAYGNIRAHQGWIEADDARPGAVLRFFLPATDAPAEAEKIPAATSVVRPGRGRILLVEDEPEVRRASVRSLRRLGYEVLEAGDGLEAEDVFRAGPHGVACVLLDVVLPKRGGLDTFYALREVRGDIPILFTSGLDLPEEAARLVANPAERVAFLPKPFDIAGLSEALAAFVPV